MVNVFYQAVGSRIRAVREASGLSQEALAAAAGIDRNMVGRAERGLQNLSLLTIGRLSLALDVAPASLLEGVTPDAASLRRPARRKTQATAADAAPPDTRLKATPAGRRGPARYDPAAS